MKKKQITIHKRNEIIRGSDDYSVFAKRTINAIYYLIQTNINNGNIKAIEQAQYIPLEFPYLRKMLNLETTESYIKKIEEALNELQKPMKFNNFKNPRDGQIYNWYSISILSEASWKIDNNKKIAYVSLSPLVKWLMMHTNDGNFTKLELVQIVNKLRTKYAMKIYEYLKSFGAYRYLDITQKHLMKLLNLDEKSTYKYYSKLEELLERQLNEIVKKTDLKEVKLIKSKALAKEKVFRIVINPKSKKDVEKTEAKTAIENLIKRF